MHTSLRLVIAAMVLGAAPSLATPTYRVTFNGNDVLQSTPVSRAESYPIGSAATFTGEGFAYPGHIGCFDHVDYLWPNFLSAGQGTNILVSARATDFVISGPSGPSVTGTLHFHIGANFARVGGFAGSGAHGSTLDVQAAANNIYATGTYAVNNAGTTTANGIFTGLSGNSVDVSFSITGTFPVGSPFLVDLNITEGCSTYGNDANENPGYAESNVGRGSSPPITGGLKLEEVGGVVMDLPAGYRVDSPEYGVVNSHYQSIVSVEPSFPVGAFALALHPNPAVRNMDIDLSLPRPDQVRIQVFDTGGRLIRTLASGRLPAGPVRLRWDGRNEGGDLVQAGVYFLRATVGRESLARRLVRLD